MQIEELPRNLRFRIPNLVRHLLWLVVRIVWLKVRGQTDEQTIGRWLREFCQQKGVLWIKVGQLISMRADLATQTVRDELAKLQDRVSGFPPQVAIQCIEEELGAPLERYFSEFEETPIAAASIGQVHRGRLKRENVVVAVKIRRPNVEQIYASDMKTVRFIIALLEWLRYKPQARWRDMLWELEEAIQEELDYRFEATNMRRMAKTLRKHDVYVPKVFECYCTKTLLVMEFIHGVLMSDYLKVAGTDRLKLQAWRQANNVDPKLVARRILHSSLRQMFEDNLFHGDLHPGNIVLLRDSQVVFIDYGSVGSLEVDFIHKVDLYIDAMSSRQYSKMVDIFFLFSHSLPPIDFSDCKEDMLRRLQAWDLRSRVDGIPFTEKSFNVIMDELVVLGADYGVSPVWSFFRMTRTLTTMDASFRELIPNSNIHELTRDYYHDKAERVRAQLLTSPLTRTVDPRSWFELQQRLIEDLQFRSAIVRRAAAVFETTTSRAAQFVARFSRLLALLLLPIGALLVVICLCQYQQEWMEWLLGRELVETLFRATHKVTAARQLDWQIWVLLFLAIIFAYRRFTVLKEKLLRKGEEPT